MDPRHHPGYLLSSSWELEVIRGSRDNQENILLGFDSFTLPERSTRSFDVIYGPGYPIMTYPGPIAPFSLELDLTTFYDPSLWEFLVLWHEQCRIDFWNNVHDGHILGYDDERNVRYKADCLDMWCMSISLGVATRQPVRHTMSVTLFIRDIIHDFDYSTFTLQEDVPGTGDIL